MTNATFISELAYKVSVRYYNIVAVSIVYYSCSAICAICQLEQAQLIVQSLANKMPLLILSAPNKSL